MAHDLETDACIKADVLGMWTSLRRRGVDSFVFTSTGESSLPLPTMHYADMYLLLRNPEDLLIYHCRSPQEIELQQIRRLRCRVAIRYHSDIPAKFVMRDSASLARHLRQGQDCLAEFCEAPVCAWLTDSRPDADALVRQGIAAEDLVCLPPFTNIARLIDLPDHPLIMGNIAGAAFNILAVGSLHPGNGHEVMFESFARALATGRVDLKLHIVGAHDPRFRRHIDHLVSIINRHGMNDYLVLYGDVSPSAYATLLRHCDLFWTASELDGFQAPLADAMAFRLPILAARTALNAEICGDAAVFAASYRGFAAALDDLANDTRARARLGKRGFGRYMSLFQDAVIERGFGGFVQSLGNGLAERVPAASLKAGEAWFDLPSSRQLIDWALAVSEPLPPNALKGSDRRRDFIDWCLRDAWQKSPEIKAYFQGADFAQYIEQIALPPGTGHFTPAMRLVWSFCRFANATFRLRSLDSITGFDRWFGREARTRYGLFSDL